jgi:prepilin-type N-terminal cleavage/methylation domain-containing protein
MPLRKKSGFSLIEVLISVAIIATMIVSMSLLMQRIPIDGREVRDQDLALKIAHNEVEVLRSAGYDALPASGPFANSLLSSLASSSASVTVSTWSAKTKRIDVSVLWRGAGLVMRSVVLTTLVTQDSALR